MAAEQIWHPMASRDTRDRARDTQQMGLLYVFVLFAIGTGDTCVSKYDISFIDSPPPHCLAAATDFANNTSTHFSDICVLSESRKQHISAG